MLGNVVVPFLPKAGHSIRTVICGIEGNVLDCFDQGRVGTTLWRAPGRHFSVPEVSVRFPTAAFRQVVAKRGSDEILHLEFDSV